MNYESFFAELKRRNVYKVGIAYAVVGWLVVQVVTQVFPLFEIPNWAVRLVVLLLTLGFPAALIFSWAFEITPEGIKRESEVAPDKSITRRTGRKIAGVTVIVAVLAAGLMMIRLLRPKPSTKARPGTDTAATNIPQNGIAVLPFENLSDDKSNAYFTDGIQDEILTRLAKIADLKVISRTSTQHYKSTPDPALGYINGELRFWLGWTQEVAGDHAAAQQSWQQARSDMEPYLKAQPENYILLEDLALTRMGLGDKAAALALTERAMTANPIEEDAVGVFSPIEILARVAARMGESDRAIAALQKLLLIP